ncbi:MAG TPA: alpha-glucuronidase, partial [Roseateles sp.]|nr:alpha-glucuronidase [Roseateles sp.]
MRMCRLWLWLTALALAMPLGARAEDGRELWLRYRPLPAAGQAGLRAVARAVVHGGPASPTLRAAVAELRRGVAALAGREP